MNFHFIFYLQYLEDKCLAKIDEDTEEALKSEHFLAIDHETLCFVFSRNTLLVDELALFKAVNIFDLLILFN